MQRLGIVISVGVLIFWMSAMVGWGNSVLVGVGVVAVSLPIGFRWRTRRQTVCYGEELRFALVVIGSRRKWADLLEILGLAVHADLRRSWPRRLMSTSVGRSHRGRRPVQYIPLIAGVTRKPYGAAVTVVGAPGQSLETWQRHCGELSSALRVREVIVAEPNPGAFELQLRVRDPLANPVVLAEPPVSRHWELPLGINEQGVPITGWCHNVSGVVVGGVPGGGKSAWLAMALVSLAQRDDVQWLLIDGKQGYDLEGLASRAYRYVSGDDAGNLEVVRDALQDVQRLMRERLRFARELYGHANLWSAKPSRLHPVVLAVIDECQTYLDGRSLRTRDAKAVGAEIESIVQDLVKRGRSAGIVVVLSTQRPTADSIPTGIRDNCALRVCFSVRTREAARAVLGEFSTDSATSPIGAPTGVGVSSLDGVEFRFRSPFVPDSVLRRHVEATASLAANPVDLLCGALMDLAAQGDSRAVSTPETVRITRTQDHTTRTQVGSAGA